MCIIGKEEEEKLRVKNKTKKPYQGIKPRGIEPMNAMCITSMFSIDLNQQLKH